MADRKPADEKANSRTGTLVAFNLRMPRELLAALDAWLDRLNENREGPEWTRSDIIRSVITRALRDRGSKGREP